MGKHRTLVSDCRGLFRTDQTLLKGDGSTHSVRSPHSRYSIRGRKDVRSWAWPARNLESITPILTTGKRLNRLKFNNFCPLH